MFKLSRTSPAIALLRDRAIRRSSQQNFPRLQVTSEHRDLEEAVALRAAGFAVVQPSPDDIAGTSPDNFVNKDSNGRGVQLELTTDLRTDLGSAGLTGAYWCRSPLGIAQRGR